MTWWIAKYVYILQILLLSIFNGHMQSVYIYYVMTKRHVRIGFWMIDRSHQCDAWFGFGVKCVQSANGQRILRSAHTTQRTIKHSQCRLNNDMYSWIFLSLRFLLFESRSPPSHFVSLIRNRTLLWMVIGPCERLAIFMLHRINQWNDKNHWICIFDISCVTCQRRIRCSRCSWCFTGFLFHAYSWFRLNV